MKKESQESIESSRKIDDFMKNNSSFEELIKDKTYIKELKQKIENAPYMEKVGDDFDFCIIKSEYSDLGSLYTTKLIMVLNNKKRKYGVLYGLDIGDLTDYDILYHAIYASLEDANDLYHRLIHKKEKVIMGGGYDKKGI